MKIKEKLANEYAERRFNQFGSFTDQVEPFIAGFEAALTLAAELHEKKGYSECLGWNDFINVGEEEVGTYNIESPWEKMR